MLIISNLKSLAYEVYTQYICIYLLHLLWPAESESNDICILLAICLAYVANNTLSILQSVGNNIYQFKSRFCTKYDLIYVALDRSAIGKKWNITVGKMQSQIKSFTG